MSEITGEWAYTGRNLPHKGDHSRRGAQLGLEESATHDPKGGDEGREYVFCYGEGQPLHIQVGGIGVFEPFHAGFEIVRLCLIRRSR